MSDVAYIIILTLPTIVCLIGLTIWQGIEFNKERMNWDKERQILLNRIQDPKFVPKTEVVLTPAEKRQRLEQIEQMKEEAEEYGKVGRVY